MTEKHWFIFRGDHHLGPFSFEEILTKVKLTEIDQEELTWCEGSEEWLPVKEQPQIQSALEQEFSTQKEEEERLRKEVDEAERQAYLKQQERLRQKEEADKRAAELKRKKEEERIRLEKERAERERKEREAEQWRLKQLEEERKKKEKLQALQSEPEDDFEGPPPLPPLPLDQEESFEKEPFEEAEEGAPPGLPPLEGAPLEEEGPEFDEEEEGSEGPLESFELPDKEDTTDSGFFLEDEDFYEAPSNEDDEVVTGVRFYVGLGLAFFGLVICGYLIGQMLPGERPLHHLTGAHRDALKSVRQRPFKGRAIHRLRPSQDLNSLWLASNYPYEAALFIALKTIPGRILSGAPVELQARAVLRGGAAHFDEIKILKGESIPQGEYEYVVKGKRIGIMGKLFYAIGDKPLFKSLSFSKEHQQEFSFRGKILLSSLSEDQFEARLKNHQGYLNKQVIRPLEDRLERYKTFMGLLQRVENIYQDIMRRITQGRSISMFEKKYNEEVGPFLRDLIIDNNRLHISLLNLKPKESKAYEDLMNFGKAIGEIASDMVTKTRSYESLGRDRTKSLIEQFRQRVADLKNEGGQRMQRIKAQLAPFGAIDKGDQSNE